MNNKLTIFSMLDVSTAHITEETNELLGQGRVEIVVYPKEFGFFVCVPDQEEDSPMLPDDLQGIVSLAQQQNCEWILIDRDAEKIDALPTFDW